MTVLLATLALFAGNGFAPTVGSLSLFPPPIAREVTWQDISDYVALHATARDPVTEEMFRTEAEAGIKTWVLCAGSSGGGEVLGSWLDGPGAGWPSIGHVLRFPTAAERDVAAAMIDELTEAQWRHYRRRIR